MPYFVNILQAGDGSYYVGQTQNLEDQMTRHRSGRSLANKSRSTWKLVHSEKFNTRSEAMKREREIKSQKSRIYIQKLVRTSRA